MKILKDYDYRKMPSRNTDEHRNFMRDKLKDHIGHNVVCVAYGSIDDPVDICIECEDCGCVLVSAEDYDFEEDAK